MLRLRLLWALTLGTHTQAFIICSPHRFPVTPCSRGRSWAGIAARNDWQGYLDRGETYRRTAIPMMRTAGPRGNVRIDGAAGESYDVKRKRPRRPDIRAVELVALQTAVAQEVISEEDQEMLRLLEQAGALGNREGSSAQAAGEGGALETAPRVDQESAEASVLEMNEKMGTEEEGASQMFYDKYTRVFVPVDGVMVKKSYGFWTWQVFGFIFLQHWIRRMARKGFNIKKVAMGEINWDHVVTEPAHLKELKAYCCENCGYTLYPARGRHERFFDDVEDFRCPECDAPRSSFYDANDPDDPHNKGGDDEEEGKENEDETVGGETSMPQGIIGDMDSSTDAIETTERRPEAVSSTSGAFVDTAHPEAEESQEEEKSSIRSLPIEPAPSERATDDDEADDLLDF